MYPDTEFPASREFELWLRMIEDINRFVPVPNKDYHVSNVSLQFLNPPRRALSNINNSSVVFLLKSGNFSALFTGDIERDGFSDIKISQLQNLYDGRLSVLKVPHHGGSSSLSENIAELNPVQCLMSVGVNNRYNHPHANVLSFYESIGCSVVRTDISGSVAILVK